jgi:hypothetical protein
MFKLLIAFALLNYACGQQFWSQCTHLPNIPTPHRIIAPRCNQERCRIGRGEIANPTAYIFFGDVHEKLEPRAIAFVLGIGKF